MLSKLIITFSVFLYALAVPVLEINATHVYNRDWTPHVRIHEVWQLITNSSIGVLCLGLTWKYSMIRISAILSLLITGGFLFAFAMQDFYGGSMKYLDGSEKTLLGMNIGLVGFGVVFILLVFVLFKDSKKLTHNKA